MLSISPDQVHLWILFENDVPRGLLQRYRNLLTDEERQQEERFHFMHHRRRFLMTRALVRTVLSKYFSRKPEQWHFTKDAYGRPFIQSEEVTPAPSISFNISHTDGLIVCAVTDRLALGVDTESVRRRAPLLEIAERMFSPHEAAIVRSLPEPLQVRQFYHYWTLKESYIKAKGLGLSIPLGLFSFSSMNAERIVISFDAALNDSASFWRFWSLQASAEHVIAVCVKRVESKSQQLVTWKTIPLERDEPFGCEVLQCSD